MSTYRNMLLATGVAAAALAPLHAQSAAEICVREGNAAGALAALRAAEQAGAPLPRAEAAYWKGRALVMLERPAEAAECFSQVPKGSHLHPYAARGLIYCAWKCPELPFAQLVAPLTASPDAEVSTLALAALAEHSLRYTEEDAQLAYSRLKELARQDSALEPVVRLLALHRYRLRGDFAGGIEYAKSLEQDTTLPPLMRQRVRLALAELYYAKEAAPPETEESDEGKGEETLLQFITANPESPLLDEAFRRLYLHAGATGSDYVRAKLKDWGEDTAHSHRAALALYILHQMDQVHGNDPATLANRAAAELPGEPTTRVILQEQIRKLLARGKAEEAQRYLTLLGTLQKHPDARTEFFTALLGMPQEEPAEAMALFHRSAESADSALLTPALVNTLITAMRCGDEEMIERLLTEEHDPRTRCALLLVHAGLLLQENPERARRELAAAEQLAPTPEQRTDIELDMAQLMLSEAPEEALQKLQTYSQETRSSWSEPQQLRYAALLEHAADAAPGAADATALLHSLYEETESLPLKQKLALHLADRLARSNKHGKACELLLGLAQLLPGGEAKAATLLYAGHESALLGSLQSLEEAVKLYEQCARQSSPLSARATIEQAAVLVRINRSREALELLRALEQQEKALSGADQAYLLTVLAEAYGLDMTPQSLTTAITYSERIATIPGLDTAWRVRGYLQCAALCTRLSRHEDALTAYRHALQMEQSRARADEPQSCQMLYYAAAGAVYQLLQMKRYEEAADLADTTAAWPGEGERPGPKSEVFARWAQNIRQMHFISAPVQEPLSAMGD